MVAKDFYTDSREAYWRDRENRADGAEYPRADARGVLVVLWRRKLTVLAALLFCCAAAGLYLALAPSKYAAATSILIDPRLGQGIGADPAQPGFVPDTSTMDSQVKLLTSQTVLARAAKAANLAEDPEFNGSHPGFWSVLFGRPLPAKPTVDLKALDDAITIRRPERTYIVEIEVLSTDPNKAATIANAIAKAYIGDQVDSRVDAAENDGKFVSEKLTTLQNQIAEAEDAVETYKTKNNIVTTEGLRSNEQQIADLTKELGVARARTSDARARLQQLQRATREGRVDASNEALKSPTIERLRSQQVDSEREVARLAQTLGSRHPALLEAQAQQAKVNRLILDELQRVSLGAAGDYQVALGNEQQLSTQIDQLKGQSNQLSRNLVPLRQLERNADSLRASYERFSHLRGSLSQQEADSPPARVIAVARPPLTPSSPRRLAVLAVALAGGLFLGLGIALLRESLAETSLGNFRDDDHDAIAPVPAPVPRYRARGRRRYWDDEDDD
jgi:succinoglycan biosynthesis transport protein ExoP